ncbi:hypothetical protein ACFO9Q_14750 [Paenibacillus sp. GCM10023252]|uniref:hypothetical protein n=1 Tax=Paenibacillus sp. GCM10023252 TaxID=3252649 RepID=UPI00360F0928
MKEHIRAADPSETLLSQSLESFQRVQVGGNTVIISVDDSLAIGAGTDFGDHYASTPFLSIYAENILLSGRFKANSGVLSTHSLTVSGEGCLDLSGSAGLPIDIVNENPTAPGMAGNNGEAGGNLLLYIEQTPIGQPAYKIQASGGNGGAGQSGTDLTAGGKGGDGGDGGHVLLAAASPYLRWQAQMKETLNLHELSAKQAMLRELIAALPPDPSLTALVSMLHDAAEAQTDEAYLQSLNLAALTLQALATGYDSSLTANVDCTAGAYGVHGDGRTNEGNGIAGQPGTLNQLLFQTPADLAAHADLTDFLAKLPRQAEQSYLLVHPSQCKRLLEKIKLMYWSLDPVAKPQGVRDVLTLLLRLQERTATFVAAKDDSSLAAYYNSHEAAIGAIGAIGQLRAIHDEAVRYLYQLRQGQDMFGYDNSDVPLGSFHFYNNLLNELITNFGLLEADYAEYFQALAANTAHIDKIKRARDRQASLIATAEAQLTTLRSQAVKTARIIDGYQAELPSLKRTLEDKIEELKEQIRVHFDFNFDTIFQSLTSLAFAPESKLMILNEASQFLYQGTMEVTDDKGEPVRKSYIVRQLKSVKASIDTLQEGFQALDNGTLAPDDPGAAKLVAAEQDVEQFFNDFYDQFPQSLDDLKTAFRAYIDKVQERNNQILTYNAIVLLLYKNLQIIDSANARTAALNEDTLDAMSPDLPDLVTLISELYYAARNQVMEMLDLTSRAYRFWALSDQSLTSEVYAGRSLPELNHTALVGAMNTILGKYQQAVENFGTNHDRFPPHDNQRGKIIDVPAEQVELFKDLKQLMIRIPVDHPVFAGMANVRVQNVRVWMTGIHPAAADDTVTIRITHTGKEQMVSSAQDVYTFKHEPVNKIFIYHTKTQEIMEEANFGVEQSDGGTTNEYAALGPFTTWHISIDPDDNPGIDLSSVSQIQIEFHGTNYAFDR